MIQFGESFTADFEEKTWTFEMTDPRYKVSAGIFAIIPIAEYYELKEKATQ